MGSKARKREMRQTAAKAREAWLLDEGGRHAATLRQLSGLSDSRYQAVQQRALNELQKSPMGTSLDGRSQRVVRDEALVVLGAMTTLQHDRVREQVQPQRMPTVNEMRAGMGKEAIEGGNVPLSEYAELMSRPARMPSAVPDVFFQGGPAVEHSDRFDPVTIGGRTI